MNGTTCIIEKFCNDCAHCTIQNYCPSGSEYCTCSLSRKCEITNEELYEHENNANTCEFYEVRK